MTTDLITFAQYMENALYGPGGYYASGQARSGRAGDYFTAPDVGPIFGRLLGSVCESWCGQLGYSRFSFIEAGAGEGALAGAIGQSLAADTPDAAGTFDYTAVEVSPVRRAQLEQLTPTMPFPFQVRESLSALQHPPRQGCLFANELIDALPVHRVRFHGGRLQEAYVRVSGEQRTWHWGEPSTDRLQAHLDRVGIRLPDDYETEINLAMADWIREASAALLSGFIVLVDYGRPAYAYYDEERDRGTLRGFHRHRIEMDLLSAPGHIDLTADVDFTSLALDGRAAGLEPLAFLELGSFLSQAAQGLLKEGRSLALGSDDEKAKGARGFRYLVHPEGMGAAFHVLILGKGVPAGAIRFEHNRLHRLGREMQLC